MRSNDFSHSFFTDITSIFISFVFNIEAIYLLMETFSTTIYLKKN